MFTCTATGGSTIYVSGVSEGTPFTVYGYELWTTNDLPATIRMDTHKLN